MCQSVDCISICEITITCLQKSCKHLSVIRNSEGYCIQANVCLRRRNFFDNSITNLKRLLVGTLRKYGLFPRRKDKYVSVDTSVSQYLHNIYD